MEHLALIIITFALATGEDTVPTPVLQQPPKTVVAPVEAPQAQALAQAIAKASEATGTAIANPRFRRVSAEESYRILAECWGVADWHQCDPLVALRE